jgi:hypothetical protein
MPATKAQFSPDDETFWGRNGSRNTEIGSNVKMPDRPLGAQRSESVSSGNILHGGGDDALDGSLAGISASFVNGGLE